MIISFTGFMGVGKSTVASLLAKELFCKHYDLDRVIESKYLTSVNDIIANYGEDDFRDKERITLAEIISKHKSNRDIVVISLGGGALLTKENQITIKTNTTCIYLKANITTIKERLLSSKKERVLIRDIKADNFDTDIISFIKRREYGYIESSHHVIEIDHLPIKEIINKVMSLI